MNAVNEGGSGARHAGVFNADVDSLGDDSSTDTLVDDNTEGVLGDIENDASLSVVVLVGHTLLDGTVGNDINVISLSVAGKETVHGGNSVSSERCGEQISCSSSLSKAMGHVYSNIK